MSSFQVLVQNFLGYAQDLLVPVLIGFVFSGIINEFIPGGLVQRFLGDNSWRSILMSTFVGALMPVCCVGSLPIAVTLRSKGAKLGPILAFLVATPATSASAIFATWKMMGFRYALFMCLTVIFMGLLMGFLASATGEVVVDKSQPRGEGSNCCESANSPRPYKNRVTDILMYAFYDLPKRMGFEILVGMGVASTIVSFEAVRNFIHFQLAGFKGYAILVLIGLVDYVCSTASVPVAHALSGSGVSMGKSMVYLLMGPITSFATLVVIRKEYGFRILALYLLVIVIGCLTAGISYDFFFSDGKFMG